MLKVSTIILSKFSALLGPGITQLENRKSYPLWRHKTELSQIGTPQLIFSLIFCNSELRNSKILSLFDTNKFPELQNSRI